MGLFYHPIGQKNTDASGLGGGNPDDRERPKKPKKWGSSEGRVSGWELKKIRAKLLREGLSKREVAIVDAAAHNAVAESGGQKGMNYGELNETLDVLTEDASKIGFRKDKLDDVRDAFEERL